MATDRADTTMIRVLHHTCTATRTETARFKSSSGATRDDRNKVAVSSLCSWECVKFAEVDMAIDERRTTAINIAGAIAMAAVAELEK